MPRHARSVDPTRSARSPALEPISPALFRALARRGAYPSDPSAKAGVAVVQTHISWVFLTGARAYKLRKAVDLGFVRFATRAERVADCVREVRLNRRLSPDVYLGVAALVDTGTQIRVGALMSEPTQAALRGVPSEICVVMRRLPAGRDARTLLARGALRAAHLDAVADLLARFHARHRLGTPVPLSPTAWWQRCTGPVRDNFRLLGDGAHAGVVTPAMVARAARATETFATARRERFEARRRAGRAVDGHGDLHLEHVWFERDDAPPLLVDCLEFRDDLRRIDAASEVAFLAMDLAYRGQGALAERFLRRYAAAADDFDLYGLVDYYTSYRAAVRAKVACVAAADPALGAAQRRAAVTSARRHLALAVRALRARKPGPVIVLCGTVGSGKSSVAQALADAIGGVVIASDVVRKGGAAMRDTRARRPARYEERAKQAVYTALLARAAPVVDSGRAAILDATFERARSRLRAQRFASQHGARALLLQVRCDPSVALRRLARREAEGRDASDAGPGQLAASCERFEPPAEWPRARRAEVRTDGAWRRTIPSLARRVRAGG